MKSVLFRADADESIGVGHVVRSHVLAEEFLTNGWTVTWVSSLASTQKLLNPAIHFIETEFNPLDWKMDVNNLLKRLKHNYDLLVVDHYGISGDWLTQIKTHFKKILVLDDVADRKLPCDILLDQNFEDESRYQALVPSSCMKLLGPTYALIR